MRPRWAISLLGVLALGLSACSGVTQEAPASGASSAPPSAPAAGAPAAAATKPLTLDSTFGTNGISTLPLSSATHDRFMAITVGADGKTYAAGFTVDAGDQSMAVARIDDKGKLDPTFGANGFATVNVAAAGKTAELARGIVVQSTGKIVVAGPAEHDPKAAGDAARDTDVALARFDATGKLDPTFGTNGVARIDLGTGRLTTGTTFVGDSPWGLAGGAGDKLYVMATKLADGADRTDADYVVVGLTNNGALDTAFGAGGKVVVDLKSSPDNARTLLVQPDGKIVATGYSTIEGVVQPVLIRLTPAGVLDSTFGSGGVFTAKVLAGVAESYSVIQQGANYVLAGYGRGADTAEKVDLIAYRFTGASALDSSFGTNGVTRIDIAKEDDRARNLLLLPDDRILVAGSGKKDAANVDGMIVLLSKDGVPDRAFGDNGHLISDLGGPADSWYGVTLSPDKKYVLIAGYKGTDANSSGNDDSVVARIAL